MFNYTYRNPYNNVNEMSDNLAYTIGAGIGTYYNAQQMGKAANMSTQNRNIFSGFLTGVNVLESISNTYRGKMDYNNELERQKKLQSDSYVNVPYDRYAYNSNFNNSYNQVAYQDGGLTDEGWQNYEDVYGIDNENGENKSIQFVDNAIDMQRKHIEDFNNETDIQNNQQEYDELSRYSFYENEQIKHDAAIDDWINTVMPNSFNTSNNLNIDRVLEEIKMRESGGDPYAVNKNGGEKATMATGLYQFVPKYWGEKIAKFQGTSNLSTAETMEYFKRNPDIQEQFMRHVVNNDYIPVVKELSPIANQYGLSQADLIKMLHYRGIKDTRERLQTGNFKISEKEKATYKNPDIMDYIKT